MNRSFFLLALAALFSLESHSQSYIGHSVDNYSGVHGILFNPASVVDSNFRTDINLFSASAFAGSDYFGIDLNYALESTEGFSFDDQLQRFPRDDNQFFLNVDVLGPSFMFNLNPKSSLAVTTRVRGFMNLNNINGNLYESLEDGFDTEENFDFELENFTGTVHTWGELGVTYGRILMDAGSNFLKGGVTLKYLQGAGTTFLNAPSVTGQYDAEAFTVTSTGNLSYGGSPGFDSGDIDFSNLSSGFGADLGFTYEYRPQADYSDDPELGNPRDYKFKVGLSITDFGEIKYAESTITSYDLNNTVDAARFENEDIETVLEEDYEGTETILDAKISLPTAAHLLVDYKIRNKLFMAVQGSMSLIGESKDQANRIINSVTAVPRFESKWLSFYLPVGVRQYDGFTMGAGLRFGPLSVGSGSVISNYISDSAKTTDFYVGLKIPVYR